jgi:hypothetical protein
MRCPAGELAFETGGGAHEQVPRRLTTAVSERVRGAAGSEGQFTGGASDERVADTEDELTFKEVERLVEVVAEWPGPIAGRLELIVDDVDAEVRR